MRAHLDVVREFFAASGKWQLPAAELAAVLLLVVTVVGWVRLGRTFERISAIAVATLGAALVTLALTAIFGVHLQMLSYPLALGAATLVLGMEGIARPLGAITAAVCVVFALWSSLKLEDLSNLTLHTWTTRPPSTPGLTLESARRQVVPGAGRVTYAVLGRNTRGRPRGVCRQRDGPELPLLPPVSVLPTGAARGDDGLCSVENARCSSS